MHSLTSSEFRPCQLEKKVVCHGGAVVDRLCQIQGDSDMDQGAAGERDRRE